MTKYTFDDIDEKQTIKAKVSLNSNEHLDDYQSYFVFVHPTKNEPIMVQAFAWDSNKNDKVKIHIKLGPDTLARGAAEPTGIEEGVKNSATYDKLVKKRLRQHPDYKAGYIQEWRVNSNNKLERIKGDGKTGNVQIVSTKDIVSKAENINRRADEVVGNMSVAQLEQILAAKKRGPQSVVEMNSSNVYVEQQ